MRGLGLDAYVVGGAVRNALLKLPVADIDIATTALPAEVIRRLACAVAGPPTPTPGLESAPPPAWVTGSGGSTAATSPGPAAARPRSGHVLRVGPEGDTWD